MATAVPADGLSFKLTEDFLEPYRDRRVDWGYTDVAGNSLGEITFLRTYSRIKPDGTKERWWEVCRRVVEGMFSIQLDHCRANRLPWNGRKAQATAQDAYERMFTFRWTPPGRGLWMMGTRLVNVDKNSAALQNCAFVSTGDMNKINPTEPFTFLMEASMLGIGVGFDTKGADKGLTIHQPGTHTWTYVVPDSREGWVQSVQWLLESYFKRGQDTVEFDYDDVRPAGEPIKTFGGTAAGPEPLMRLHAGLRALLDDRDGQDLTSLDILDIANLIGVCVVSGNVRRSAELALGSIDDKDFLSAKHFGETDSDGEYHPGPAEYRQGWGWMSNNSVAVNVDDDLTPVIDGIARNGEPGIVWLDVSRNYGRLIDPPDGRDHRVAGYNPCAEQSLESFECCTLVETFLGRHDDLADYKKTLKVAYLYAKTVTLLPTHWEQTNAIMQRNRRVGTGVSGVANFADRVGMTTLRTWMNEGYAAVQRYDEVYSEWLCVRESIKTTTVKPSGTVSILAGESPGVHWAPGGEFFDRGIVFQKDDPIVRLLEVAGYSVEESAYTPETSVFVQFPVHSKALRSEGDVSLFEKANLAVLAQRYWSDNSVSVTLSFDPATEGQDVATVLHMHTGQLKTVSFLPRGNAVYKQMPYQTSDADLYDDRIVSESEKLTGKARGLFDDDDPAAELPQGL
jgi:ribonucleoside-triphosphate reductase